MEFLTFYVTEAHPIDGWIDESNNTLGIYYQDSKKSKTGYTLQNNLSEILIIHCLYMSIA